MAIVVGNIVRLSQLDEILTDLTSTDWIVIAQDINGSPLNRLKNARDFAVSTRDEAVNLAVPQAVGQIIALLPTQVPLPVRTSITSDELVNIIGSNNIGLGLDAGQLLGFYSSQAPSANGDTRRFISSLNTGISYNVNVLYASTSSGGTYDVVVNGITALSIDAYSASTVNNLIETTVTPISITDPSVTIDIITTGQNVSSSGFDQNITKIWLN